LVSLVVSQLSDDTPPTYPTGYDRTTTTTTTTTISLMVIIIITANMINVNTPCQTGSDPELRN
jgi:hypothetical protein